jgi:hypothetical protein
MLETMVILEKISMIILSSNLSQRNPIIFLGANFGTLEIIAW